MGKADFKAYMATLPEKKQEIHDLLVVVLQKAAERYDQKKSKIADAAEHVAGHVADAAEHVAEHIGEHVDVAKEHVAGHIADYTAVAKAEGLKYLGLLQDRIDALEEVNEEINENKEHGFTTIKSVLDHAKQHLDGSAHDSDEEAAKVQD